MQSPSYFYQFLKPISKELAFVARELEISIYQSPRTMLTHARVFVENILQHVIVLEKLPQSDYPKLKEQIDNLYNGGILETDIRDALHFVRMSGNQAAHDARLFRYSEALLSWEAVYKIVKWYVEVYGPVDLKVPEYQDPKPQESVSYDITEVQERLRVMEELLISSLKGESDSSSKEEVTVTTESMSEEEAAVPPGFTTNRKLFYKGESLEVPHFLRDAFLLPQRFGKSETFLIRLGANQQARIMSELPNNLEGLHKHVKRYNDKNDENLFHELKVFIEEEKQRRQIYLERPGELFLFYRSDYVIVTEELGETKITADNFAGIPSLIRQLKEDQIQTVGQLPKELVILAKYENVGVGTVEKLFEQLKEMQRKS
ncbi:DUF4145 domain-containing protein [Ornithinibacillus halophilus]|uniref:DUF4145 domain-containing protein n=1 Tax=Ornithinibacillus halophilus TaxID=930117 RepID=A0A1M5LIC1_9BACI|nr:DUF4145 domain-containing protein [Ornithinibacillus halophilus]SHG64706.1 protein of unknown function [Ornithinibacillus halophilus]